MVVKVDIFSLISDKCNMKVDNVIHHNIISTCGNENVKYGSQKVEHTLCLYVDTFIMYVLPIKYSKEAAPRSNWALWLPFSIKLEKMPQVIITKVLQEKSLDSICNWSWIYLGWTCWKEWGNNQIRERFDELLEKLSMVS